MFRMTAMGKIEPRHIHALPDEGAHRINRINRRAHRTNNMRITNCFHKTLQKGIYLLISIAVY
jgi:hypothetical protein